MAKDAKSLFANKKINKSVTVDLSTMDKEKKKVQSFMLEPKIKDILSNHLKSKGISWGAGLRMIIIDYLKNEKVVK